MTTIKQLTPFVLAIAFVVTSLVPADAVDNPKNRIDFWQNNYDELTPSDDPLAERAHRIFERVLNAAGRRPGVVPRLFIVNSESDMIPLAIAIPDGGIIISKKVLTICYQDPKRGGDRLAFLLGHEIAHQLKDDFWHMRFFEAVDLSRSQNPENSKELDEVRTAARMTDKVLTKEIEADGYGIVYAAIAGFDTRAIINEDDKVNFFEYVAASLDPGKIKGIHKDPTHPSPKERAVTVKARLKQVVEKTDLYDLGLLFYQAGDFERAALFFKEFMLFFPSREVYHNLATCHHQLALRHYRKWKKEEARLPFKLSLAVEPVTQANQIGLRAVTTSAAAENLFRLHIEKAIKLYKSAIDQDPAYRLSYNNLGCALLIKGDEVFKAIGLFKDAYKLDPKDPQTLNNLGVAFYLAENPAKANEYLAAAVKIDPAFGTPLFNLGKIAHDMNNPQDARQYWTAYLKMDAFSPWADSIRQVLSMQKASPANPQKAGTNSAMGLEIGAYDDEAPGTWGRPVRSKDYDIGEFPFKVNVYANGYMTISENDQIIIIATRPACKDTTSQGIAAGDSAEKVAAVYGPPEEEVSLAKGKGWLYPALGMAFVLQDDKVSGWTLF